MLTEMKQMMEIQFAKHCVAISLTMMILTCSTTAVSSPQVTAMFAFGDSLTDPGNNYHLSSLAKANYVPYGVDFNGGTPSGRFCNGKTFVDYIGELLGLPILLPYTSPFATGTNVVRGVNDASAAGGILEETGRHLGERFSLSAQVVNFESTLSELRSQMGDEEIVNYLAKAIVVMSLGRNDSINNYMLPSFYSNNYIYAPKYFADLLINSYTRQILALRSLGLRKFLLGGVGPLRCIPNQLAGGTASPGKCVAYANNVAAIFKERLKSLVDDLNTKYNNNDSRTIFAYGNTFGATLDILNNANTYGFNVIDRWCCGIGRNQGQITCLQFSVPCYNRNEHIFWDAFHPTEAVNRIPAQCAYSGSPSDCHPLNIQQMALI